MYTNSAINKNETHKQNAIQVVKNNVGVLKTVSHYTHSLYTRAIVSKVATLPDDNKYYTWRGSNLQNRQS